MRAPTKQHVHAHSGFPWNEEDVKLILGEHAITHIVSIKPTDLQPEIIEGFSLHQVQGETVNEPYRLIISLPKCVDFIHAAIEAGGRVLVHSLAVSSTSMVICAYCKHFPLFLPLEGDGIFQVMSTRKISVREAAGILSESMYTVPGNFCKHIY